MRETERERDRETETETEREMFTQPSSPSYHCIGLGPRINSYSISFKLLSYTLVLFLENKRTRIEYKDNLDLDKCKSIDILH